MSLLVFTQLLLFPYTRHSFNRLVALIESYSSFNIVKYFSIFGNNLSNKAILEYCIKAVNQLICKTEGVQFLHQVLNIFLCNQQIVIFTIGKGTQGIFVLSNAIVLLTRYFSYVFAQMCTLFLEYTE